MSTTPAAPATPKLNPVQVIEQEIAGFVKQKEQAVINLHVIDGAIQAGYHLLAKVKAEAAKVEAEVKAAFNETAKP